MFLNITLFILIIVFAILTIKCEAEGMVFSVIFLCIVVLFLALNNNEVFANNNYLDDPRTIPEEKIVSIVLKDTLNLNDIDGKYYDEFTSNQKKNYSYSYNVTYEPKIDNNVLCTSLKFLSKL